MSWVRSNWKSALNVCLLVGVYVLYKFFPELADERDLMVALGTISGVFGTAFIPSFTRSRRDE